MMMGGRGEATTTAGGGGLDNSTDESMMTAGRPNLSMGSDDGSTVYRSKRCPRLNALVG